MANPTLIADIIDGIKTEKNYIRGQVEKNTAGWTNFKNSVAGIAPEAGAGTTADSDVTWALTTTNPISGAASFQLVKPAANRQGNSKRFQFTIDRGDRYKVQRIFGKSEVVSGTFTYGDGTTASPSSVRWYIRDVTNDVIIEPTQTMMDGSGEFFSEFQTTDSLVYELILHIADATTNAWTINFDLFCVGPRELARGPILETVHSISGFTSTWDAYGPGITALGRRVGDCLEAEVEVELTGATVGALIVTLPPGMSIDTSKINLSSDGSVNQIGFGHVRDAGANQKPAAALYQSSTTFAVTYFNPTATTYDTFSGFSATAPQTWANGDSVRVKINVPILGWESNTVISSDSGTRAVAMRGTINVGQVFNSGSNDTIKYDTVQSSTGQLSLNTSTGVVTVNESGWYWIIGSLRWTNIGDQANTSMDLLVNNVLVDRKFNTNSGASNDPSVFACAVAYLAAGQTFYFQAAQTSGAANTCGTGVNSSFSVFKIQSPQSIGMADRVACKYTTSAGSSISASTTTFVDYGTKVYDTHNMVVGAGGGNVTTALTGFRAIVPMAGLYQVNITQHFAAATFAIGDRMEIDIRKNNTIQRYSTKHGNGHTSQFLGDTVVSAFECVAGDVIQGGLFQNAGTRSLISDGRYVQFELVRIG